jgi:hypothetical protein
LLLPRPPTTTTTLPPLPNPPTLQALSESISIDSRGCTILTQARATAYAKCGPGYAEAWSSSSVTQKVLGVCGIDISKPPAPKPSPRPSSPKPTSGGSTPAPPAQSGGGSFPGFPNWQIPFPDIKFPTMPQFPNMQNPFGN